MLFVKQHPPLAHEFSLKVAGSGEVGLGSKSANPVIGQIGDGAKKCNTMVNLKKYFKTCAID